MDRNSIIGLLLIGAIIIGFSVLNKPNEEEVEKMRRAQDSITQLKKEIEQQKTERETTREVTTVEIENTDSADIQRKMDEVGTFGKFLIGEDEYYTIENNLMVLTISAKGGRPYSVRLKNYQTYDSMPLFLFNGDSTIFNIQIPIRQNRVVNTQDLYFDLVGDAKNVIAKEKEGQIRLRVGLNEEQYMDYVYSMSPKEYMVNFKIIMNNLDDIITSRSNYFDMEWEIYAPQQEKGKINENNYSSIYFKHYHDEVDNLALRTKKEELSKEITTSVKWVAFKDQFFSSVIIADEHFSYSSVYSFKLPEEDKFLKKFRAELGVPYNGGNTSMDMRFYFGPNHFKTLKKYDDIELHSLVYLGRNIIKLINRYVIIELFNLLQRFISNYGLIIFILTIVIKMALLPLTYKSYISQAKMRVLKPQIDEINAKIPKDKAMERQKATMDLYKKVGINPIGGCLPMLLQMPILLAMFRFFPTSIELRQQSFLWANDLSTYDSVLTLPFNIPLGYGNHVSLFTILMTVSTLISIKMNSQATGSNAQMPGMKGMMYIMPIMFMFMLNSWSSGLTYYYFLANMITFGQNMFFKRFVDEDEILKKLHAKKAKPQKKSSFQARMEKMAKNRGYNLPKK